LRLYEINTRIYCHRFDDVTQNQLIDLSELGFDALWFMGIWQISEGAKRISRVISEEFSGSPFAVPSYTINRTLGGKSGFTSLVDRAHIAGLSVFVDFVPNHMAIDSPWIDERPDFFIRSNPRVRPQSTSEFFLHPSGELIAFGRDPYFPPWHDTSQLDYTAEGLRSRMTEVLKWISSVADGVRCDMAMLVLRDFIRQQWYPAASEHWFKEKMPGEFWDRALSDVKLVKPDFYFLAESYWDKERELLNLGFDLAYEKRLYDGLARRDLGLLLGRLSRPLADLCRSLYFIENHDEPRAASIFNREENLAAAALILSLPGSVLVHDGQLEGKRERLPVQRLKPQTQEPPDEMLRTGYRNLLRATRTNIFKHGSFHLFDTDNASVVGFFRQNQNHTVAYLGQVGEILSFASSQLDVTPLARAVSASSLLRIVNLLSGDSVMIEPAAGRFRFQPASIGVGLEGRFCLVEVTSA
jgi:glycosidase